MSPYGTLLKNIAAGCRLVCGPVSHVCTKVKNGIAAACGCITGAVRWVCRMLCQLVSMMLWYGAHVALGKACWYLTVIAVTSLISVAWIREWLLQNGYQTVTGMADVMNTVSIKVQEMQNITSNLRSN